MVILIIDDDPEDTYLFCEALKIADSRVECFTSTGGQWPIDVVTTDTTPDVIVLDINMPKLSGKEILSKIKDDDRLTNVPVYMFSTTKNEREIDQCMKLGAAGFFIKPTAFDSLVDIQKEIINVVLSGKNNQPLDAPTRC